MNAKRGSFSPKKNIDPKMLRLNWAAKINKATFTPGASKPFCHTKNKAMPINRKRIVQTGPKIQLGGLKEGLVIVVYQVFTELIVKKEPIIPASWHITTEIMNMIILFIPKKRMLLGYKNVCT